jgi:hypothetical protein
MMNTMIYFYCPKNVLLIPRMVQTESGFYIESDPVMSISLDDSDAVEDALRAVANRAMDIVPTPKVFPKLLEVPSVKASRAKSYSDFVRYSLLWNLDQLDGGGCRIQRWVSPPRENHFVPDNNDFCLLAPGFSIADLSEKLIEVIRQAKTLDC